jgi:hypothetical protein
MLYDIMCNVIHPFSPRNTIFFTELAWMDSVVEIIHQKKHFSSKLLIFHKFHIFEFFNILATIHCTVWRLVLA